MQQTQILVKLNDPVQPSVCQVHLVTSISNWSVSSTLLHPPPPPDGQLHHMWSRMKIFVITLIQKLLDQAKEMIFYQRNESNRLLRLRYAHTPVWCSGRKSKTHHSIWFHPSTMGILLRAIKEPNWNLFAPRETPTLFSSHHSFRAA